MWLGRFAPVSNDAAAAALLVLAVRFFLDHARPERGIDAPLDRRPFVVLEIDGTGQADEFRIEGLRPFLVANVVFDSPQALVDCEQSADVGFDVDACTGRSTPSFFERAQFMATPFLSALPTFWPVPLASRT